MNELLSVMIYNPRTGQYEEHAEWPEDMIPYQVEGKDGLPMVRLKFKLVDNKEQNGDETDCIQGRE